MFNFGIVKIEFVARRRVYPGAQPRRKGRKGIVMATYEVTMIGGEVYHWTVQA